MLTSVLIIAAMEFSSRRNEAMKLIYEKFCDEISRLRLRSEKLDREFNMESLSFEDDLQIDGIVMDELRYDLERELNINIDSDQYDDLINDPRLTVGKFLNFIDSI